MKVFFVFVCYLVNVFLVGALFVGEQNILFQQSYRSCGKLGDRQVSSSKCEAMLSSKYTCNMYLAMVSYVKDNIGSFTSAYSFNSTKEILVVQNDTILRTYQNFTDMLVSRRAHATDTWTGSAEDGALTSQNCFDWALNFDCFYGTISNITNQPCNYEFYVDCFGIECHEGTATPSRAPTTSQPTGTPSTSTPTGQPTTSAPSDVPSRTPTTSIPTKAPSVSVPTLSPTTSLPTAQPTMSLPTNQPTTSMPSSAPSKAPTTSKPTISPSVSSPTMSPTTSTPSVSPTTSTPSVTPTTSTPSKTPTLSPTTSKPSFVPSKTPTLSPTVSQPTTSPSKTPTTSKPSVTPTTSTPTKSPSTSTPTKAPTTSIPTASPTATYTYALGQLQYSSSSPTPTPGGPSFQKYAYNAPLAPRSFNCPITPTSSPTFDYTTPPTQTVVYINAQAVSSTTGAQDLDVKIGSSPPTAYWTASATSYPWAWTVSSFNAADKYQQLSVVAVLPASNSLRISNYDSTTLDASRSFLLVMTLGTLNSNYYSAKGSQGALTSIFTPTPTPTPGPTYVSFTTYRQTYPTTTTLAPVSSPTMMTIGASGGTFTVINAGVYYLAHKCWSYENGIVVNGGTFESRAWEYAATAPVLVSISTGRISPAYVIMYLSVGDIVTFITDAPDATGMGDNTQNVIWYHGSSNAHVQLKCLGAVASASGAYIAPLLFNSTSMRETDTGFTSSHINETTGIIRFPGRIKVAVTCSVRANTNTAFRVAIWLNQQAVPLSTANCTSADTGRLLAVSGFHGGTARTPARYAQTAQAVFVMTKHTDYIQCSVESSDTGQSIASLVNTAQTTINVVKLGEL